VHEADWAYFMSESLAEWPYLREMQAIDPDLVFVNDMDFDLAAGTRRHVIAELAEDGASVVAGHFRGIGRFEPAGKGFRWAVE
jgi:hypothetical protein